MIGTTISHYRILQKLGAGGMGEVYLAEDTRLDRKAALKFLPPSLWNDVEARQRLVREAKAASQLDHPNIVTIYGIEESEGRPFIHMANVQGVSLAAWGTAEMRSTAAVLDLAIQLADALRHAHAAGVVHRDLKPSNIMVDDGGRARILDFGIASLRGAAKLTQTGMTIGTLAYAPPELAKGMPAEPASDIWSLGIVLYEMLAGRLPFAADHDAALLYAILHQPAPPLTAQRPDASPELQAIVARCLEKEPSARYADCAALLADLRKARTKLAAAGDAAPADKPSIAVLPFANMSADPENEFFSDGLSEELLNVLAKNPALKVTGRTSSFAFKGRNEDLRKIGHELGVGTLLEGSVRKAGNRVRITAQLVKASDGFHLWSETYDRVLDDIFAVQDDIARAVSEAMHVTLLGRAPAAAPRGHAETYELVLRANHLVQRMAAEPLAQAVALYEQALAIAPDDARAWAGLALALLTQHGYGFDVREETLDRARVAAEKAMALDPSLAEAHYVLGWVLGWNLAWDEAAVSLRRAYALAPGDGRMINGVAVYESAFGNHDEARRLARRAAEIDPLSATTHLFHARVGWCARDYEGAIAAYARALELSPSIATAHANAGICLVLLGRAEEGLREAGREASVGYRCCAQAIAHHALGNAQASDDALEALIAQGEIWAVQIAGVCSRRGEVERAFEWLDRAVEIRDSGLVTVKVSPLFEPLHQDPRWTAFMARVGFGAT